MDRRVTIVRTPGRKYPLEIQLSDGVWTHGIGLSEQEIISLAQEIQNYQKGTQGWDTTVT